MGGIFTKLFAPWKAGALFESEADYQEFLLRRNRLLNAVRTVLFAIAAVCLILAYATDRKLYNYIAVGVLAVALGASLVIIQNEKQLPEELRNLSK